MKVLDIETKGNLFRFYLGLDYITEWTGESWNIPLSENIYAPVNKKYVHVFFDVVFPFDTNLLLLIPNKYSKNELRINQKPLYCTIHKSGGYDIEKNYLYLGMSRSELLKFIRKNHGKRISKYMSFSEEKKQQKKSSDKKEESHRRWYKKLMNDPELRDAYRTYQREHQRNYRRTKGG